MVLWHGSQKIIEAPQFGLGKVHNDYGQGFYCTESLDLAREWACSGDADGFVNRYELDMTDLKVLDLLSPHYSVLHWIASFFSQGHRYRRGGVQISPRSLST